MSVLVIGAGPAGLSAAAAAREFGADVRLLDSADATGGQFWRHLPNSRPSTNEHVLHHGWRDYTSLRDSLQADPRVQIDLGAHVWAIEQSDTSFAVDIVHGRADGTDRRGECIATDTIVVATGAHDRALPVPGWTLPGVFTAGAAQALAKGERVAIGERVVVAGAGPFLLPVSVALGQTGARVVAVIEAAAPGHLGRSWLSRPTQLLRASDKARELGGYVRHHLRHRIPYRAGHAVVAIHGTDSVDAVTIAKIDRRWQPIAGTERRLECDAVCLGHGFVPRLELAIAAGCDLDDNRFVVVDETQRTTAPGVYAAGEITGVGGADLARAEGRIAGWAAAGGTVDAAEVSAARRAREVFRSFAARIETAHGIGPEWTSWLEDDTVICRCEEVDHGCLRRVAAATESTGLRSLKLSTRASLGACQGRVCGRNVEKILADRLAAGDGVGTDRRPVALPIRLGELAAIHQTSATCPPPRKETPE